jgi:hypothetical protein
MFTLTGQYICIFSAAQEEPSEVKPKHSCVGLKYKDLAGVPWSFCICSLLKYFGAFCTWKFPHAALFLFFGQTHDVLY